MRIPGPNDLFNIAGHGYQAAERAIALVPRLVAIVGDVEQIMVRVHTLIGDIEKTNRRAAAVVGRTETVVTRAEKLTGELVPLLDKFQPSLDRLEPMIARLASTTSPVEVDAIVKLIDTLPDISEKMRKDILPVLDTLGTVAPDVRDLLEAVKQFNEMLGAVPGLGRVKKKIEERQEMEDELRADETPPAAPERES